jgi:hypothetical protein
MLGTSWVAAQLAPSQEGLSSMSESVSVVEVILTLKQVVKWIIRQKICQNFCFIGSIFSVHECHLVMRYHKMLETHVLNQKSPINARIWRVSFHFLHNKHIRTDIMRTIKKNNLFSLFFLIANICWNKNNWNILFRVERPIVIEMWVFSGTMNYGYNSFVYSIKYILLIYLNLPFVLHRKHIVPSRNINRLLLCREKSAVIVRTMIKIRTHLVCRV